MQSSEIRERFLYFFKKKKHKIYSSSSIVPENDPSLLFTSAGMVPFKDMLLGITKPESVRAASSQYCFRTNDIEQIGYTKRHHTFFEMLGNFSFGDYFKKEAIQWAWEFLTEELNIETSKLYASVFTEDNESYEIWQQYLPKEKIVRLGEESNFWRMSETGPCGPCSEILIDRGEDKGCGSVSCGPGCNCDRYLEIWNLVFTQFDQSKDGKLNPLSQKNIDTGMGLERITAVVQNVPSNFETDLIKPILDFTAELTGVPYNKTKRTDVSLKIIADHVRGIAFLIMFGVLPSNEGRGYVLRRILRRAAKEGKLLGVKETFLYKLCNKVVDIMGPVCPELISKRNYISEICKAEEDKFMETLNAGYDIIHNLIKKLDRKKEKIIPGDEVFKLYDTYGFPVELTKEIAKDKNFDIDEEGFGEKMKEQKAIAGKSWKGINEEKIGIYRSIYKETGATIFRGYEFNKLLAKLNVIVDKDNNVVTEAVEGDEIEVVLSETPFYGESGGQIGDTGKITKKPKDENGDKILAELDIIDTLKYEKMIIHRAKVLRGKIKKGDIVEAIINLKQRTAVRRSHTATHLLQSCLRDVLGEQVEQSGSFVNSDSFRFDFTYNNSLKNNQIQKIEGLVNGLILKNLSVLTSELNLNEAKEIGATALFGEKYGEKVRTVMISSEGWDAPEDAVSIELCAGTHANATGDIGLFKIISEASSSAGIRRMEVLTGEKAYDFIKTEEENLQNIAELLKVNPDVIEQKIEKIISANEKFKKEVFQIKVKLFNFQADEIIKSFARKVSGISILSHRVDASDAEELRSFGDILKNKLSDGIIVLGSIIDDKPFLICMLTNNLQEKGLHAGNLIKKLTQIIGGSGGGRADLAQGGGKDKNKLDEALSKTDEIVREMIKK